VNGVYIKNGALFNNEAVFENPNSVFMFWSGRRWLLSNLVSNEENLAYYGGQIGVTNPNNLGNPYDNIRSPNTPGTVTSIDI